MTGTPSVASPAIYLVPTCDMLAMACGVLCKNHVSPSPDAYTPVLVHAKKFAPSKPKAPGENSPIPVLNGNVLTGVVHVAPPSADAL